MVYGVLNVLDLAGFRARCLHPCRAKVPQRTFRLTHITYTCVTLSYDDGRVFCGNEKSRGVRWARRSSDLNPCLWAGLVLLAANLPLAMGWVPVCGHLQCPILVHAWSGVDTCLLAMGWLPGF